MVSRKLLSKSSRRGIAIKERRYLRKRSRCLVTSGIPILSDSLEYANKKACSLCTSLCQPGGSLDKLIHDKTKPPMDLKTRMSIAFGLANAILHVRENGLIHRDAKPANVLLDKDLNVKLADFGTISEPQNLERRLSTYGYNDPHPTTTFKTDVYSFGVIMLELMSGHKAIDSFSADGITDHNGHIFSWAEILVDEAQYDQLVDPRMPGLQPAGDGFVNFLNFVLRCAPINANKRPEIREAVEQLSTYSRSLDSENAGPST